LCRKIPNNPAHLAQIAHFGVDEECNAVNVSLVESAQESSHLSGRRFRQRRSAHAVAVRALKFLHRVGAMRPRAPSLRAMMRNLAAGTTPHAAVAQRWLANKGIR
jgi:hypothetical protein